MAIKLAQRKQKIAVAQSNRNKFFSIHINDSNGRRRFAVCCYKLTTCYFYTKQQFSNIIANNEAYGTFKLNDLSVVFTVSQQQQPP